MIKFFKKYPIIFFVFFFLWSLLLFYSQVLFKDIPELTTEGASLVIKMLEFIAFRSKELLLQEALYFILLSLNLFYIQYALKYIQIKYRNIYLSINFLFVIISMFISNIFFSVTLFLIFLSFVIVWSSEKVYTLFASNHIIYNEGDLVYSSEMFSDEKMANLVLKKWLDSSSYSENVVGKIMKENNGFYFDIIASQKLQIDKKELF